MYTESSILSLLNLIIISVRAIRWLTKVRAESKPALCSFCDYIKTKLMGTAGIISVTLTF